MTLPFENVGDMRTVLIIGTVVAATIYLLLQMSVQDTSNCSYAKSQGFHLGNEDPRPDYVMVMSVNMARAQTLRDLDLMLEPNRIHKDRAAAMIFYSDQIEHNIRYFKHETKLLSMGDYNISYMAMDWDGPPADIKATKGPNTYMPDRERNVNRMLGVQIFSHPLVQGKEYIVNVKEGMRILPSNDNLNPLVKMKRQGIVFATSQLFKEPKERMQEVQNLIINGFCASDAELTRLCIQNAASHTRFFRNGRHTQWTGVVASTNLAFYDVAFFNTPNMKKFFAHVDKTGLQFWGAWSDRTIVTLAVLLLAKREQLMYMPELNWMLKNLKQDYVHMGLISNGKRCSPTSGLECYFEYPFVEVTYVKPSEYVHTKMELIDEFGFPFKDYTSCVKEIQNEFTFEEMTTMISKSKHGCMHVISDQFTKPKRPELTDGCEEFGCSCQGVSNCYGTSDFAANYYDATREARVFWQRNKCATDPPEVRVCKDKEFTVSSTPPPPPQPVEPVVQPEKKEENVKCDAWNCSCQGASDCFDVSHDDKVFGSATEDVKTFWGQNKCTTSPSKGREACPESTIKELKLDVVTPSPQPVSSNDDVCKLFGCSCQAMSDCYGTSDKNHDWGRANGEETKWWVSNGCKTNPSEGDKNTCPEAARNIINKGEDKANSKAAVEDDVCKPWGCTCQGFSDCYGVSATKFEWGTSPVKFRHWWPANSCETDPSGKPCPAS